MSVNKNSLVIHGIPEAEKEALRHRAAEHGRSMEAELRAIIHQTVKNDLRPPKTGLGTAMRERFTALGGVDLPEHPPVKPRDLPDFE